VQVEEAVMDHEPEGEAVEGEDPETTGLRPTTGAEKLRRCSLFRTG
jgi:hypothetical protein